MKVTIDVTSCSNCPHFGIDGAPGSVFVCNHPNVKCYEIVLDPTKMRNEIHTSCPIVKETNNRTPKYDLVLDPTIHTSCPIEKETKDPILTFNVGDKVRVKQYYYQSLARATGIIIGVYPGEDTRADITHCLKQVPNPVSEYWDGAVEIELNDGQRKMIGIYWIEPYNIDNLAQK